MERTNGISQTEKVLLKFNGIPRLGIRINLRKPIKRTITRQEAQTRRRIEQQQVSDTLRLEAYRLLRAPL